MRFKKPAPAARAAPPEAHESLIGRKTVEEEPLTGLSIGDGGSVSGHKPLEKLRREWALLKLPDLAGKAVLDINTWDGWFALQAERHGARQVVALDSYMWSMDLAEHTRYCQEVKAAGGVPRPYHEMPYFRPDELPGKIGFDTARSILGSGVEDMVGDFATMSIDPLRGRFDVVLYLGTLYHMADPIGNLRRLYEVTAPGGLAVIETQAMSIDGLEHVPLCENHGPLHPLNTDSSNWWSPNALALRQMLLAVGFETAEITVGPPPPVESAPQPEPRGLWPARSRERATSTPPPPRVRPYRAYAHARRSAAASTSVNPVPFM